MHVCTYIYIYTYVYIYTFMSVITYFFVYEYLSIFSRLFSKGCTNERSLRQQSMLLPLNVLLRTGPSASQDIALSLRGNHACGPARSCQGSLLGVRGAVRQIAILLESLLGGPREIQQLSFLLEGGDSTLGFWDTGPMRKTTPSRYIM